MNGVKSSAKKNRSIESTESHTKSILISKFFPTERSTRS